MTIDFGRNTYQHEVSFRFDCISPDLVLDIVDTLLLEKKLFSYVSKEPGTSMTLLSLGSGTKEAPYRLLKLGADKLNLWCGWYAPYETWRQWRAQLMAEILDNLASIPSEFVSSLMSQGVITVPYEKMKLNEITPEFEPVRRFFNRFIPPELMKRWNGASTWSNEESSQIVEWWMGAATVPDHEAVVITLRDNLTVGREGLRDALLAHSALFEKLFADLQSNVVSPLLKP